ncbi:hypothetical protein BJ912DRAFT_429497 [Pholiota molesta]|nr:hypothetical protein BJ912DRAFT_429497 [Pholiota molesta]
MHISLKAGLLSTKSRNILYYLLNAFFRTHPTHSRWETVMEDWQFLSSNNFMIPAHTSFARQAGRANAPYPALSHITNVPHSLRPGASNTIRRSHQRSLGRHLANHPNRPLPWPTTQRPYRRLVKRSRPAYQSVTLKPARLTRKPRDWRGSYRSSSKGGLGRYFSRIGSIIPRVPKQALLQPRLVLNSIIAHPTWVSYDLRIHPSSRHDLNLPFRNHPLDAIDLTQPVSSPLTSQLVLWHRKLPWYINIQASHPSRGVTIQDLLEGIYEELELPIGYHEYCTAELTSGDRDMLNMAFQKRCRGNKGEIRRGVRRIDFLGQECCFAGISRSRNGTWELKTIPYVAPRMMLD